MVGAFSLQGACLSYRTQRSEASNAKSRSSLGSWDLVGKIMSLSEEHLVGTTSGTQTCRTVRRRVTTERWDKEALTVMSGLPWDTKF